MVVGAGAAKRSTAGLVFTLFPDKVLGEAEVELETTEISLNRCSYKKGKRDDSGCSISLLTQKRLKAPEVKLHYLAEINPHPCLVTGLPGKIQKQIAQLFPQKAMEFFYMIYMIFNNLMTWPDHFSMEKESSLYVTLPSLSSMETKRV